MDLSLAVESQVKRNQDSQTDFITGDSLVDQRKDSHPGNVLGPEEDLAQTFHQFLVESTLRSTEGCSRIHSLMGGSVRVVSVEIWVASISLVFKMADDLDHRLTVKEIIFVLHFEILYLCNFTNCDIFVVLKNLY